MDGRVDLALDLSILLFDFQAVSFGRIGRDEEDGDDADHEGDYMLVGCYCQLSEYRFGSARKGNADNADETQIDADFFVSDDRA